jgi:hypothetical protein
MRSFFGKKFRWILTDPDSRDFDVYAPPGDEGWQGGEGGRGGGDADRTIMQRFCLGDLKSVRGVCVTCVEQV